jgi:type IV secretory pathway VirB2 component (pilin)
MLTFISVVKKLSQSCGINVSTRLFNHIKAWGKKPPVKTTLREIINMLTNSMKNPWAASLCWTLTLGLLLMPDLALAAGGQTIADVLCTVVGWFTGNVGKGIATLAIIIIGVGALMGKVSWGMAIIVGIGVAVIFGAAQIVDDLGGQGNCG